MEYLIINLLAISIMAVVFYRLANRIFGISIRLKSLLLCAVCAILLSLIIPRIIVGFAGLFGTIALLTVLAISCAFLIAYYDDDAPGPNNAVVESPESCDVESNNLIDVGMDVAATKNEYYIENELVKKTEEHLITQEVIEPAVKQLEEAEDVLMVKTNSNRASAEENLLLDNSEIASLETLDELMEYAFTQKELQNIDKALGAFRKALDIYPQADTAPFLIIEIGGILKRRGAYDEAIEVFSEGRRIAAKRDDSILEKEFIDIIAYLRIIKNTLIEKRLGLIAFEDIPKNLLDQLNTEYSDWKKLS